MVPVAGEAQVEFANRVRVALYGAVQGVGFRPFVYRLASELGIAGWVLNSSAGLVIEAEGPDHALQTFLRRLESERPRASVVLTGEISWLTAAGYSSFEIRRSDGTDAKTASILPDLATCPECLQETLSPGERRHEYPFTNCTRCGPRFTIVQELPYDRPNTTMREFELCADCAREYKDPGDRRFHAQPIACPACGPRLDASIEDAAAALSRGEIVALKGIGGFQLLADARNAESIRRLRERKGRDAKPFGIMLPDMAAVRARCHVSESEAQALTSPASPIVLLVPSGLSDIAANVCDSSPFVGIMLPYSPMHHLLMRAFPYPIVATSGNLSGDPIVIENAEAQSKLGRIADLFVSHNRPIARPCDDSVVRITRGRECMLRRARGYAPLPIRVGRELRRVLAVGPHMKNTVGIAVGQNVFLSQHIGDLDTLECRNAFENAVRDLCRLYDFDPEVVACDLHPDYWSTTWARDSARPVVAIQHHMAHAAACAAENDLREPYLAVVWDGTGYGLDQTIWGGEFFACDGVRMDRIEHLRTFRLPGGEKAVKEGWRTAAGLSFELGADGVPATIAAMLKRNLNCPLTSSMGRLFDAVAAITGIARESRFEGQAAMQLERAATRAVQGRTYSLSRGDWRPLIIDITRDLATGTDPGEIALGFHQALAEWIIAAARPWRNVVLSGGVFQNALLTGLVVKGLEADGKRVYTHQRVPPNDGGIALGQAVLAAG